MFNCASSGHEKTLPWSLGSLDNPGFFLHHRTIKRAQKSRWFMGLENHPVAKKELNNTCYTFNMKHAKGKFIIYIYIFWTEKRQRLFYSWFWLMLLVSPTHVPCHGEKIWDADRPRSGRLSGFGNHQDLSTCRAADCPCVARGSRLAARGSRMEWGSMGISWWGVTGITTWLWCRFSSFKGQRDVKFHRKFGMSETAPNVCESNFSNTGAHWCSILAAREGLKWFLVLTACWLVIVVYSWKTSFKRLPKQLVKHHGAEHGIPPGKSTSGYIMLIHVQPQTWDLVNLVL